MANTLEAEWSTNTRTCFIYTHSHPSGEISFIRTVKAHLPLGKKKKRTKEQKQQVLLEAQDYFTKAL